MLMGTIWEVNWYLKKRREWKGKKNGWERNRKAEKGGMRKGEMKENKKRIDSKDKWKKREKLVKKKEPKVIGQKSFKK